MLIDTHAHLNDPSIYERRREIVENAIKEGVSMIVCVGYDLESSRLAVSIANEFPVVYAAIGVHPENLYDDNDAVYEELRALAKDKKVIAIGEIGLDYHWFKDQEHRDRQAQAFVKQIEIANELELPVSIHSREASEDTFKTLLEHPARHGAVLHCYGGSVEMMRRFEKLGVYFGFDGPVTFKNAKSVKENVSACRSDRIVFETDSPYMAPVPYRGKENEPQYVKMIYEEGARLRFTDIRILEKTVQENVEKLFHVKL